jgi:two-component system, NarL family, response regulator LiaR
VKRHVLTFGLVGGLFICALEYIKYRFMTFDVELYGALVAILFSAFGVWLGQRITRRRETVVLKEVRAAAEPPPPLPPDTTLLQTLGLTARELEVLNLIARGLSNREIAAELFVSENTIKTHCARAFDKLGASRRTQAVRRGKELGLLA